jgi:hypothetical protein
VKWEKANDLDGTNEWLQTTNADVCSYLRP